MAIWQATFWLVPENTSVEPDVAWLGRRAPIGLDELCETLASRNPHWDEESKLWGDHESHCIEATFEGLQLESIRVRIDLRDPNAKTVAGRIVALARALNAEFIIGGSTLHVPASADAFAAALEGSSAMRFVSDPSFFLRWLQLGGLDDA
jgi:hypothetical protein